MDSEEPVLPDNCSKKVIKEIIDEEDVSDAEISVKYACQKGDNYLGEIYRVSVANTKNGVVNLIVKTATTSSTARLYLPISSFYQKEFFTYREILPALDKLQEDHGIDPEDRFHHAKFYKGSEEDCQEMLVMEDVTARGYMMNDPMEPLDLDHIKIAIRSLAKYHAASFALKDNDPETYKKVTQKIDVRDVGDDIKFTFEKNKMAIISLLDDHEDVAIVSKYFDLAFEKYFLMTDSAETSPYNVICQGDFRANNLLFSYKEGAVSDVIMIDWQLIKYASPIIDLSYFIFMNTDEDLRNDNYRNILDFYHESLSENLSKYGLSISTCYPKEVFEDQIQRVMPYGLIMAFLLINIIFPIRDSTMSIEKAMFENTGGSNIGTFSNEAKKRMKGIMKSCIKFKVI